MSSLLYVEPELIIALGRNIIFVNPNDLQIFKELQLPTHLNKLDIQIAADANEQQPDSEADAKSTQATEVLSIQHAQLAPNRLLFAISTAGQKALLLYQCRPEHAKLISVRNLARASSALAFKSDSKALLVTDKTGDCYLYDCEQLQQPPKLLLGHLSIVYDVLWTPDSNYIISCDRDDKIRVTNYPATHDIHSYCLGHKEFVSSLALLAPSVIASASGDKTLRLWNYETGKQLCVVELPAPALKVIVRALNQQSYEAALLLHQSEQSVVTYELIHVAADVWQSKEGSCYKLNDVLASNICFVQQRIYVTGIANERLVIRLLPTQEQAPENWLQMVEEQFQATTWQPEDIASWFKKRYDNVSDYLERKKRRIEEKQK